MSDNHIRDRSEPQIPAALRRSGERRDFVTPLTLPEITERLQPYLAHGKRRADLERVDGRAIMVTTIDSGFQVGTYKRYMRGVLTTAYGVWSAGPGETRIALVVSALRYSYLYFTPVILSLILIYVVISLATGFWESELWLAGLYISIPLLGLTMWRLSRGTDETREEKRYLVEFIQRRLDAEEVAAPRKM